MKYYDEYIHEIILVNDNSTDNTKDVICKLQKTNNRIRLVNRSSPNGVGRDYEMDTPRLKVGTV